MAGREVKTVTLEAVEPSNEAPLLRAVNLTGLTPIAPPADEASPVVSHLLS